MLRSCGSSSCWQHGHGEDHARSRADGPVERRVGRGVARVQADDEVDSVEPVVAGDLPHLESQPVCSELPGERLAVGDDVRLEVEPDEVDLHAVHDA